MLKRIDARIPEELLNDVREAAKDEGVTVTDIIIECFRLYLTAKKAKKQPSNDKPAPEIVAVTSSCEGKNPSIEPETGKTNHILKSAKELREAYKARFPLQLCIKCQQFNRNCVC